MKKDNLVFIQDIADAIDKISIYTDGLEPSEFFENMLIQDAVLRNFTIIGEASSKLTGNFSGIYPNFPLKEAVATRNKIVHDYGNVNLDVIWKTIKINLPVLYEACLDVLHHKVV